jgi:2'-5' RNA ligase
MDRRIDRLSDEPRLFVAAPIEAAARDAIAAMVEPIRAAEPVGRGIRWVRLDQLHVTLRFLGPTSEHRLDSLVEATRTAAAACRPFEVRFRGAGAFPPVGRPRTLWLAIEDGATELAALAAALDQALVGAGWPANDRPFRAHLTLARADGVRQGSRTAEALRRAAAEAAVVSTVDRIVVFESITGGGPARYVPRGEAGLEQDGAVLPSPGPRDVRNHRQGAPHTS